MGMNRLHKRQVDPTGDNASSTCRKWTTVKKAEFNVNPRILDLVDEYKAREDLVNYYQKESVTQSLIARIIDLLVALEMLLAALWVGYR